MTDGLNDEWDYSIAKEVPKLTTIEKMDKFFENLSIFLKEKNKRYGNSALQPLEIFGGKKDSTGIDIRIDDKLSRIKNSEELRKNDTIDLVGYLVLKAIEKGWEEFHELID